MKRRFVERNITKKVDSHKGEYLPNWELKGET